MDFIEGETLLKKLQREGPMPFDTCLSLLTPIIQALAEVHVDLHYPSGHQPGQHHGAAGRQADFA